MSTVLGITAALIAFIGLTLGLRDWLRPIERFSLWNAKNARQRAIALLKIHQGASLAEMVQTYPFWSISDGRYAGNRLVYRNQISAESFNLRAIRRSTHLPESDVWKEPIDEGAVIRAYDEAIDVLARWVDDPDRKGRSMVLLRWILGVIVLFLAVASYLLRT